MRMPTCMILAERPMMRLHLQLDYSMLSLIVAVDRSGRVPGMFHPAHPAWSMEMLSHGEL